LTFYDELFEAAFFEAALNIIGQRADMTV